MTPFLNKMTPLQKTYRIEASAMLRRRTNQAWDTFNQFKTDAQRFFWLERVVQEESSDFVVCSCSVGLKGKTCVHRLALLMSQGDIDRPSEKEYIKKGGKRKGRKLKSAIQKFV